MRPKETSDVVLPNGRGPKGVGAHWVWFIRVQRLKHHRKSMKITFLVITWSPRHEKRWEWDHEKLHIIIYPKEGVPGPGGLKKGSLWGFKKCWTFSIFSKNGIKKMVITQAPTGLRSWEFACAEVSMSPGFLKHPRARKIPKNPGKSKISGEIPERFQGPAGEFLYKWPQTK